MFDFSPAVILGHLLVIFFGIPIHEWAHGWMAHLLGDDTPERHGRLTLNPLAHLDPLGTLLILLTGFGWGKPAPVNPYRMTRVRNPRVGMALSSLAGPVSNVLMAIVFALPLRLGVGGLLPPGQRDRLWGVLATAVAVNIGLAVFNMLPVPPLDGSRVLAGVAPPPLADFIDQLEPYAGMIFMLVLFVLPAIGIDLVSWLVIPAQSFLLDLILW